MGGGGGRRRGEREKGDWEGEREKEGRGRGGRGGGERKGGVRGKGGREGRGEKGAKLRWRGPPTGRARVDQPIQDSASLRRRAAVRDFQPTRIGLVRHSNVEVANCLSGHTRPCRKQEGLLF